jgi:PRTRC genetic system protein E
MFKELAPYLRQRAVLLTVTRLEDDQISVNIIPKKLQEGENTALTTPFKLTGTAEELDRDLPSSIVDFVAAHLQLKSTLERAKAEMDAAGKAAHAEARAKKVSAKNEPAKSEVKAPANEVTKPAEPRKPEPPKTSSLFDMPTPALASTSDVSPAADDDADDDDEEILAEIEDNNQGDEDMEAAA